MKYSVESIEGVISDVVDAHITPHGAQYTTMMAEEGVLITIHHRGWSTSRFTRLRGLSADIQGEIIHCAIHALAETLLAHIHPT